MTLTLTTATTPTTPTTHLGDDSLWSEDVRWLADDRSAYAVGHLAPRIRWLHLYLNAAPGGADGILAHIRLDLAGQDLHSVCAIRACPQAAICAAFALLRDELTRREASAD